MITCDPEILGGKPVINGTRLSVEHILNLLDGGWTVEVVLLNYPGITRKDVEDCLDYKVEKEGTE